MLNFTNQERLSPHGNSIAKLVVCMLLLVIFGLQAEAKYFGFANGSVYYDVVSEEDKTAEVRRYLEWDDVFHKVQLSGNPYAKGDLVIPPYVENNGVTYKVIKVGNGSFYGNGEITSIELPSTVTEIGLYAFHGCYGLKSVKMTSSVSLVQDEAFFNCTKMELPDLSGVTKIGKQGFHGCWQFKNVTLPSSLTSLGDEAFLECINLRSVIFQSQPTINSKVTFFPSGCKIAVPEGTTNKYGSYSAFYPAGAEISDGWIYDSAKTVLYFAPGHLTGELELPQTLTTIGDYALAYEQDLTSVKIPDGITSIGNYSFYSNSGLTTVTLPKALKTIGDYSFNNCVELSDINLPENLETIGMCAFSICKKITNLTFPASLKTINYNAFGETGLTSVILPPDVTLSPSVFSNCEQLEEVVLPANLELLPQSIFLGCTKLNRLTIPASVTEIGSFALSSCSSLKSLIIGPNVEKYGQDIFKGCSSLAKVGCPNKWYVKVDSNPIVIEYPTDCVIDGNFVYSSDKSKLYFIDYFVEGEFQPASTVTDIMMKAGASCELISAVTLSDAVTAIGNEAFLNCVKLETLNLGNSNMVFQAGAFNGCNKLKKVSVPSLEAWCRYTFHSADANPLNITHRLYVGEEELTDLNIPESIDQIGNYQFIGGSFFKNLTLPANLTTISTSAFKDCSLLRTVTIPDNVGWLGNSCFEGCRGLNRLTLGSSINSIGSKTFADCSSLENIYVYMPVPRTSADAFNGVSRPKLTAPTDYVLEYAITTPWDKFSSYGCPDGAVGLIEVSNLKYVYNVPLKTAALRKADYSNLKDVEIPARIHANNTFCSVTFTAENVFENCTNLSTLSIGRNLEKISKNSFSGCTNLKSVSFIEGSSLSEVGECAFMGCSNLTTCNLPETLTTIGNQAFKDCSSLKSITIGNSVGEIPFEAFKGCSALSSLELGGAVTEINTSAFAECSSLTTLVLPPNVESVGQSAFLCDNGSLKNITIGSKTTYIGNMAFGGQNSIADIYITNPVPPTAYSATFSNYKATLHVVPGTIDNYSENAPCWFNFYDNGLIRDMVPVSEVAISQSSIENYQPGDTFKLEATVKPQNATLQDVFWESTNPKVATVSSDGTVTIQEGASLQRNIIRVGYVEEEGDDEGYCEIRAYSMFADVPVAVCAIGEKPSTGVNETISEKQNLDTAAPYDVYTIQGVYVGGSLDKLAAGIYIVRQGNLVRKVMKR